MNKDNGYTTRARPRALGSDQAQFLDFRFGLIALTTRNDIQELERRIVEVKDKLASLTPSGARLVMAARQTITKWDDDARAYACLPTTRELIARQLQRAPGADGVPRLTPNDLSNLREAIALGLIAEERRALTARRAIGADGTELQLGAGWLYVYTMRGAVIVPLMHLDPNESERLAVLKAAALDPTNDQRQRAERELQRQRDAELPSMAARRRAIEFDASTTKTPSLFDRLLRRR